MCPPQKVALRTMGRFLNCTFRLAEFLEMNQFWSYFHEDAAKAYPVNDGVRFKKKTGAPSGKRNRESFET